MKKVYSISKVAAALLVGSALFVGCSDCDSSAPAVVPVSISGVAVDGYLSGAQACVDWNSNSVFDDGECVDTNADGSYSITAPIGVTMDGKTVVVTGGIDTATGLPFQGQLEAPYEAGKTTYNVTPATTIAAAMVKAGVPVAEAKAKTAAALGLSADDIDKDPVAEAEKEGGNPEILKQNLKVAKLIEFISKSSGSADADGFTKVAAKLASKITASATVDKAAFTQAAKDTATETATETGTTINTDAVEAIDTAIESATVTATNVKAVEVAAQTVVKTVQSAVDAGTDIKTVSVNVDKIATVVSKILENNEGKEIDTDTLATQAETISNTADEDLDAKATELEETVAVDAGTLLPAKLSLGTTITLGQTTAPIADAKFATSVNAGSSVSDFYNITLANADLSKAVNAQNVKLRVVVIDQADTTNTLTLTIDGVSIAGESTATLKTTVKSGANVTLSQTGLESISNANGELNAPVEYTGVSIDVEELLSSIGTSNVQNEIEALNTYLAQPRVYNVNISVIADTQKINVSPSKLSGVVTVAAQTAE